MSRSRPASCTAPFRVRAVAAAEEEPEDVLLERRPRRIKKIPKKEDIKEIAKKSCKRQQHADGSHKQVAGQLAGQLAWDPK